MTFMQAKYNLRISFQALKRQKDDRRQRHNYGQTHPDLDKVLGLVAAGSHYHQISLMGERENKGATGAVGHGQKRHTHIHAA